MPSNHSSTKAAAWMVLASFAFAVMALGIKYASAVYSTFELVFYRGAVSLVVMAGLMKLRGVAFKTPVPAMHLARSAAGITALCAWFYAIGILPLATAMTLNYMSSVWIGAFLLGGSILMGQHMRQWPLLLAVLVGFAGVVLILQPSFNQQQLSGALVGLFSGICAAIAYLQVSALGKVGEPEDRTVFYFSLGTTLVGTAGMLLDGQRAHSWSSPLALWLIPIGLSASVGQFCMTRAYNRGSTLVVACLQYMGIVFSSIFSIVLLKEHIAAWAWLGMALIVTSGIAATIYRSQRLPSTPAEEHV